MTTLLLSALKRQVDADGYLTLEPAQVLYLLHLLEDALEGHDVKFAVADLMGVLPDVKRAERFVECCRCEEVAGDNGACPFHGWAGA